MHNENKLIAEQYNKMYETSDASDNLELSKEIRNLTDQYNDIFKIFHITQIDYMIRQAANDGEDTVAIMLEYLNDDMQDKIGFDEASEIEKKLQEICSKYDNFIETEIVQAGYGYEIYFVLEVPN